MVEEVEMGVGRVVSDQAPGMDIVVRLEVWMGAREEGEEKVVGGGMVGEIVEGRGRRRG